MSENKSASRPWLVHWPDVPERPSAHPDEGLILWKGKKRLLWEGTVDQNRLFVAEGMVDGPMTGRWMEFESPQAAQKALQTQELEKMKLRYTPPHVANRQFWEKPPSPPEGPFKDEVVTDSKSLDGYIADGRFVADMKRLVPGRFLAADYYRDSMEEYVANIAHLPERTREAMLRLGQMAAAGELRDLVLNWSLGYRLTEFDHDELLENFDAQEWMVTLAEQSVEIFHDGGLAHFHACPDGIRVWCNEWYWEEEVVCDLVDVLVWLAVHKSGVAHETYSADAYETSLKNLGITSRDFALAQEEPD